MSYLMYSILRILLFTVVLIIRHSLCIFGWKPADLVADLTLPSQIVSGLETEDQLDEVLECRQ